MLPVQIRVYRVLPCRNLLSFCISLKTATSNAKKAHEERNDECILLNSVWRAIHH